MEQYGVFFILIINETFLGGNRGITDNKGIGWLLLEKGVASIFVFFVIFNKFYLILAVVKAIDSDHISFRNLQKLRDK